MLAARLVEVTLVRAWSPSEPEADTGHRISFAVALDAQGVPDEEAWLADLAPWTARREVPDAEPESGDVTHDEDGWALRFAPPGGTLADAALTRILGGVGWLRPGEVVTIREVDGAEAAWRVVAVG